jgi:hypothetical protein
LVLPGAFAFRILAKYRTLSSSVKGEHSSVFLDIKKISRYYYLNPFTPSKAKNDLSDFCKVPIFEAKE